MKNNLIEDVLAAVRSAQGIEKPVEDKIYVCLSCGEVNSYWSTCENCEAQLEAMDTSQDV